MSLRAAIIKGHLEEAKSFSSEDPLLPNESDGDLTCFHYAAHYNNSQVLAFLLTLVAAERGLFVKSRRGNTPFHSAALAGSFECLVLLLENGGTKFADECNVWKETALHLSAQAGQTKCYELLVSRGASTTIRDKWDRLASDVAAESFLGRQEIIRQPKQVVKTKILSKMMEFPLDEGRFVELCTNEEGVELKGKDFFGLTALHKLACWDKPNSMLLLLNLVENDYEFVNSRDVEGNTAAHLAASEKCLKILLDCGIDLSIVNKAGQRASQIN